MLFETNCSRISPTALYTAQVWQNAGRSVPELNVPSAQMLYNVVWPFMQASQWFGGPTLRDFMLARHDLIDHLLDQEIQAGRISHVIELAAGLSARGCRFIKKYGEQIVYVETDLPDMVAKKRNLLSHRLSACDNHLITPLNLLAKDGPDSLASVVQSFWPSKGVAIIAEGILNYFDRASVEGIWRQLRMVLEACPGSFWLSDLHLKCHNNDWGSQVFVQVLSAFVRGKVWLDFENELDVMQQVKSLGLQSEIFDPRLFAKKLPTCGAVGAGLVRILQLRSLM